MVTKFLITRLQHAEANNLPDRISILNHNIVLLGLTPDLIDELENCDRLRVEGILLADLQCRKIRAGEVPWSPKLQKLVNRIKYYRVCVSKLENRSQIHSRTLWRLQRKAGLETAITTLDKAKSINYK